jgi:hypothetical protein
LPRWLSSLGFVLLSVVLVGSLWCVPYLPTNDGPEAVFAVHMENHFGDPGVIYPDVFVPTSQFAGRGFTVLFEPLEDSLGWQRGLQVALSVMVLLNAWGLFALVRAVDPRRTALAFLGFPLALSWTLYMGFFAFVISSGVGLLILAFAIGRRGEGVVRRALVAALLLLQAFLHMFGAVLTGVALVTIRVARARKGRRLAEVVKVGLTGVPAALLAVRAVQVAHAGAVDAAFSHGFAWMPWQELLRVWPRTVAPGQLPDALVVTLLVLVSAGVAGVRATKPATSPTDRATAVLAILFLVTSLVAPRDVPGWQLFAERFVGIGLALLLVTLPLERAPRHTPALVFAASLLSLLLAYPLHQRLAATTADALAGTEAPVKRHGIWLPGRLRSTPNPAAAEVPFLGTLIHFDGLYETAQGGLTPYTFASNPASWPFSLRDGRIRPPPVPSVEQSMTLLSLPAFKHDRAFREEQESILATFGMFYEGVVLTGARPDDFAVWQRRGFVSDWQRGSVMLAHFEPCPIDVTVPGGASTPLLDVGVGATNILRDSKPSEVTADDYRAHLRVAQGPCGVVWVRPHWDTTMADGTKHVTLCANADATGELAVTVTHEGGHVDCVAAAPSP